MATIGADDSRQRPALRTTTSCIPIDSQAVTLMKQVAKVTGIFFWHFFYSNLR
jgi:hypothetical protein